MIRQVNVVFSRSNLANPLLALRNLINALKACVKSV